MMTTYSDSDKNGFFAFAFKKNTCRAYKSQQRVVANRALLHVIKSVSCYHSQVLEKFIGPFFFFSFLRGGNR